LSANGLEACSEMFIRFAKEIPASGESVVVFKRFALWSKFRQLISFVCFIFFCLVTKSVRKPEDLEYLAKLLPTLVNPLNLITVFGFLEHVISLFS
jgi:hypothetical protein